MTVSRSAESRFWYAESRFWGVYDAKGRLVYVCLTGVCLTGVYEGMARRTRSGRAGGGRMRKDEEG